MSARLGQIPELIQAVSSLGGPRTSVALMLSCKDFFNLLAPLLWKDLKGAEILFSLVEGAKIGTRLKVVSIVSSWHTTRPLSASINYYI
jgi:hypothetical protein